MRTRITFAVVAVIGALFLARPGEAKVVVPASKPDVCVYVLKLQPGVCLNLPKSLPLS